MGQSNIESITINEFYSQNTKLKFKNPLKVSITKRFADEGDYLLVGENEEINLYVFAYTLEDLKKEINQQIAMMWDEYVRPDPENFANDALRLRGRLMERIEEID